MNLQENLFYALAKKASLEIKPSLKQFNCQLIELLNACEQLEQKGLPIKVTPTQITLTHPFETLCIDAIYAHLTPKTQACLEQMQCYFELASTNDWLMELGLAAHGRVCLAEHQNQGHGRHGRKWLTRLSGQIAFSLGWVFEDKVNLEGLSLATGMAIIESLRQLGYEQPLLKWPNDIMVMPKKLGGILIEVHPYQSTQVIVIGIGMNAHAHPNKNEVGQETTDLMSLNGQSVARNHLIGSMLNKIVAMLIDFQANGFEQFLETWPNYDGLVNRSISVIDNNKKIEGKYSGVNEKGQLCLLVDGKIKTFISGSVEIL